MNSVIFAGYVTRDPEVRVYGDDKKLASFIIAENSSKDETLFMKATCFGNQAEFVEKYMKKGSYVCVSGRLKENTYIDNGTKIKGGINIVVDRLDLPKPKNVSCETKDGEGLSQEALKDLLKQMAENA